MCVKLLLILARSVADLLYPAVELVSTSDQSSSVNKLRLCSRLSTALKSPSTSFELMLCLLLKSFSFNLRKKTAENDIETENLSIAGLHLQRWSIDGAAVHRSVDVVAQLALIGLWEVGGVAQWLGRRSLAGGLSLIYAWSMVDMWPLRG